MVHSPNLLVLLVAPLTGAAILLADAGSGHFLLSRAQASSSFQLPIDVPICYMQTTDNRLVNLSQLCERQPGTVTIRSLTYNSNLVLGQVQNQSNQTAYGVRVGYQVVGENGGSIEENSVEATPPILAPGQIAVFETVLPARSRLSNTRVMWSDR